MKTTFTITGMTCDNCVKHVRNALLGMPGVTGADIDLATGTGIVEHADLSVADLIDAIVEEGYEAEPKA